MLTSVHTDGRHGTSPSPGVMNEAVTSVTTQDNEAQDYSVNTDDNHDDEIFYSVRDSIATSVDTSVDHQQDYDDQHVYHNAEAKKHNHH